MGPDQLAGVMEQVQTNSAKAKGLTIDTEAIKKNVQTFRQGVQRDSECYRTSAALLDDGIIDPRDTRDVLAMCLEVVHVSEFQGTESHGMLARL
jgi:acetyl-CoA carboxylase carboxyltransferase component